MTLIAFHTTRSSATVLTDTLAYNANFRHIGHATKVLALPHVDSAVVSNGDAEFGAFWKISAMTATLRKPDFDALHKATPGYLRELWDSMGDDDWRDPPTCFLIGYSAEQERFAAYSYAAAEDFAPVPVEDFLILPSPQIFRPSPQEISALQRSISGQQFKALPVERQTAKLRELDEWSKRPVPPAPESDEDWVTYGQASRRRATGAGVSNISHPVGGSLVLTHLERGHVDTRRVHTFEDGGEDWLWMLRGTAHPQSQLGPCLCGSGKTYLECHLVPLLDERCTCGVGAKTFRECCAIAVDQYAAEYGQMPR